ncbi:hypothetical protein [Piscinibacter sp. XHJ-5]|uniref:hypothetical protein n=1 Tax=Piscinibacter sp. XHJ-5 TaxID=3037797 RepID=UPI0024535EA2|nr:hypothetical protein [Piscinibacter sp. XHJ-5]
MLDAIKRWISGGTPGPDWSDVSGWAQKQGHGFKRARDDEGFVIDGSFGDKPWRLEWGPPQRSYIRAHELRLRMELKLSSNLQMLLLSRLLTEMLERETFERYTQSNQTLIDVSTPEEMRWLAMFPKVDLAEHPKELRNRFTAVASDPQSAMQWLEPLFVQRLAEASSRLLRHDPPFVLMTLRGRLYLRLECALPEPAIISQAVAVFEAAAQAALRISGPTVKEAADWPTTASTAWHTNLHPEDPKR